MSIPFNPFDHLIVFQQPRRLSEQSYWQEHIPFGMLLVTLLKPRVLVELGTHYGDSYCAFCQAVQESQLETRCFAVDNWAGDVHVGEYGEEVLGGLRAHHDPLYAGFSTLLQSDFDEARRQFKDGEIDLLHIDGTHTYEAVKQDYENWLPKMSERGVILFHDINVNWLGYEVRRFFDEIKVQYPHFEFLHGYGLGVLLVGREASAEVKWLTELNEAEVEQVREYFAQAGQRIRQSVISNDEQARRIAFESAERESLTAEFQGKLAQSEMRAQAWQNRALEAETSAGNLEAQLRQITSGGGWAIAQRLWRLKSLLAHFTGRQSSYSSEPPIAVQENIATSPEPSTLLLTLDSVKISVQGAFEIEGWAFDYASAITNLQLAIQTPTGEKLVECQYGLPRPDVEQFYQAPQALNAGFSALGNLGEGELRNIQCKISYADGRTETVNALSTQVIGWAGPSDFQFDLDSIKISSRGAFIAEGCVFNYLTSIASLQLVIQTAKGESVFECQYGFPRPDVYLHYQTPQALRSGFSAVGNVGPNKIQNILFKVRYTDGGSETIKAPESRVLFLNTGSVDQGQADLDELLRQTPLNEHSSAASPRRITLIFDHNTGGGANRYRSDLIERVVNEGQEVLLVYYNLAKLEYTVEYISKSVTRQIQIGALETLAKSVEQVNIETILVNNLYAYEEPLEAIQLILKMKELTKARLMMVAQDFLCVCPEINLINKDGKFCGIPDTSICQSCLPENRTENLRFLPHKNIVTWRERWGRFLSETDEIICGSNSTITLIRRAYPTLDPLKFKHRPYPVDYQPSRKPAVDLTQGLHLGVVGNISPNKGARVIEELAEMISARQLPVKLTIIGNLVASKPLPGVEITGSYRREDLPELIERSGINVCLLPSICPETYSYVTQELMILGLPLAVFNLGAPAERVANYSKGLILNQIGDARAALDELIAFHKKLGRESTEKF